MPHEGDSDPLERLVTAFRTLLDEALVVAIASDYDLSTAPGYQEAETTLKGLSQDVALEEATGFNPSGTSGTADEPNSGTRDDLSTSATDASHHASQARHTDSSSTDLSSLPATDSSDPVPRLTSFNGESDETKIHSLRSIFDGLKEYDIRHALGKANGGFQTALDDLLNLQYLQSTGQLARGIDGFFDPEDDAPQRGKKNKKYKKAKKSTETAQLFDLDSTSKEVLEKNQARELKRQDEIAFLADRTHVPYDQVSDVYYRKKCSSGAAAVDILDQYIDLGIRTEDEEGKAQAKKLATEYRNVPEKYLLTLVQVTGSSAQASDEIASLLSGYFAKNPYTQRLDLTHRITPLPYEDLEGLPGNTTAPGGKARIPVSCSASRLSPTPTAFGADLPSTIQRINVSNQARRDAESYASQLSRRGASNSLYRQAAAVYRERGHEHARHAQQLTCTAANLLVENQSTPTSIDLHGVTVRDGTRIARDKVQTWWDNLGEFRTRKAREQPFTVITGLGRHSAGGVSQLRQAVAAALLQDGWKMRVETGKFVVSGRR